MNIGDHVAVDFYSESRTEFSNFHFTGIGIIELLDDDRIYGRLYSGKPFTCNITDAKTILDITNLQPYFDFLIENRLINKHEIEMIKNASSCDVNLLQMVDLGLYIFAHYKIMKEELSQKVADLEFKLLQKDVAHE